MKDKFWLLITYVTLILASMTVLANESSSQELISILNQGDNAFQQGDFQQAVKHWEQSLAGFEDQPFDTEQHIEILIRLAAAYQALGLHHRVLQRLDQALTLAEQTKDARRSAITLSQLSDAWLSIGDAKKALRLADDGVADAKVANEPRILASALNSQGNALTVLQNYPQAIEAYEESTRLAEQGGDLALAAKASINRLNVALSSSPLDDVMTILDEAWKQINQLPDDYDKATYLIAIGVQSQVVLRDPELAQQPQRWKPIILSAYQALQEAVRIAKELADVRTTSLAYGHLGALYEQEHRYAEALVLTRQALFLARQNKLSHLLYRWYWQQGRILKAQGNLDSAIAAYRLASKTLESIQPVLDVGYRNPPDLFETVVRPVHYGLVDLLIQKATLTKEASAQQELLKEAVKIGELVKVAELKDYFKDDCVLALQSKATGLDQISSTTAILYPLPLPDKLVVLVSLKGEFHYEIVPIKAEQLNETAWKLRLGLQTRPNNRFLYPARQLYDWLIRPFEARLSAHQVDTLVVVPDGKLRLIPFSTLNDGEHFLVEKYALGLTPGLTLLDPQPLSWDDSKILLVGLSEAVQEYPPLPNVPKELETIQNLTKEFAQITHILNWEYTTRVFRHQLQTNKYSIIHLATHGEFDADAEHTYLLSYDSKMKMDKLAEIIGLGRFRDKPLELLTLSACKTAVGDDRAALGLAGVAVKAGARSALATLWFVDDEATSIAVTEFYRQLVQVSGISKAKALQNVQKQLIAQDRYWHPSYWAPFLLIGNWL